MNEKRESRKRRKIHVSMNELNLELMVTAKTRALFTSPRKQAANTHYNREPDHALDATFRTEKKRTRQHACDPRPPSERLGQTVIRGEKEKGDKGGVKAK